MPNRQVTFKIGDVDGVVNRKKKGAKAILTYREMMVIYVKGQPPIYRGRHGSPKTDEEIDAFLNTDVHPYVEFTDAYNLTVHLDGYIPLEIDLTDEKEEFPETLEGIPQPELTLSGKLMFLICVGVIAGISLFRLLFSKGSG